MESEYEGKISSVNSNDEAFYFIISDKLAKKLVADIDTNDTPKIVDTKIELSIKKNADTFNSHNVVAFIEGEEHPEEIVVISAHLDHIGIEDGEVSNGADDDGSGTVAMLEIAEAFKAAIEDGYKPKRSILFLHLTAEEKGLQGSKYYTDINPIFPLEHTVANLNIDMIGRVDKLHEEDRNYVYVIGADMLSTELYEINEAVNEKYTNIKLDYRYSNETDPNRYYYRSDHYNFAKNNIPVAFYFNGTHDDYHKVTDTPDKIQYDLLEKRTRLVFYTAWELVNRKNRILVDKAEKLK
jgi:Zn-dependent M28 family amino/carboxypeptidase